MDEFLLTPKEVMKENLYKTMMFFCKKSFNASNYTPDIMLFIRRYKMMAMANPEQVPSNLTEGNLEKIEQRALAAKIINAKQFLFKNYPEMYIII